MQMDAHKRIWHSRWWMPGFSLALGGAVFAAFAIGDNTKDGAMSFGLLALLSLILALAAPRSETVSGLSGSGRDERFAMIDLRASALSGLVLVATVIGAWLAELARGHDGSPYGQLAAVGGLSYLAVVIYLRARS
jgi:hypothetical protein